jgi:hypothetical protein
LNIASSRAIADLEHVDELVQLLCDLVDRVDRAVERQRDPRKALVLGRADGERVDVEATPGEQAGDPCQDTGFVLHEDRDDVLADGPHAAGRLELVEREQLLCRRLAHHPTMFLAG